MSTTIEKAGEAKVADAAAPETDLRYAWYVVFVLMICYTLSFVDRQILSLMIGPMKAELQITDTQVGLLGGFAFALFYTVMGLPIGRLCDRYNRRNIINIGLVLWSAMTVLCAYGRSFWSLFLCRVGVGVGEAALAPAAQSMIADYFPKERLASALSVYTMGISIGQGLALIVGGNVIQAVTATPVLDVPVFGAMASWRVAFLIVGLPGILVAVLLLTVREPVRKGVLASAAGAARTLDISETVRELRQRWQSLVGVSVSIMCIALCGYAYAFWAPAYLQRLHGWSPGDAGTALGIVLLVCGCLGLFIGGKLADFWQGRGVREAALRVTAISCAGAGIFIAAAFLANNAWWTIGLMVPAHLFAAMPTGSCYAAAQLIFPNQVRGQAAALLIFILNLGALSLGPLLPGLFNDWIFHSDQMIGPSIVIASTVASVVGIGVSFWAMPHYRRHHALMYPQTESRL